MIFRKNIGIDLGTDTTQIYLDQIGIVVNEPSIVAFNNLTNRVIAHGNEAKKMLSRTPSHITALRPIMNGVIADFDIAKEMIDRLLKNQRLPWSFMTHAVVSIPTNLTEVERKSVEDLLKEAGANKVFLIEQPLAAALGSRLNVSEPTAYLIVDMGSGTVDMAIISMNGIVVSKRLKIGGDYFNQEIIRAVRDELKLNIGEPTAEEIKIAVGAAVPMGEHFEIVVRGRDVSSGLPREVLIKDTQVRLWLHRPLKLIVEALKDLIEITPPELVGDIYKNGIYLCGGGSLLRGIEQLLAKEIGVEVRVVEEPLTCVARGTGLATENIETYKHLLNHFSSVRPE
ncbi:MAG: Cell shape determining protein, MreB/Mrl family [Candidatus Jorgensenbacteria bacterium GW2011_GWB1_49_9]|nr:MAG: Cell shape determining protein, MreB/Mrl family [Candidatus Jorgensenbacteria bacterium GW2011_GWB1_49_9]